MYGDEEKEKKRKKQPRSGHPERYGSLSFGDLFTVTIIMGCNEICNIRAQISMY